MQERQKSGVPWRAGLVISGLTEIPEVSVCQSLRKPLSEAGGPQSDLFPSVMRLFSIPVLGWDMAFVQQGRPRSCWPLPFICL